MATAPLNERLEARITAEQKGLLKEAARLKGVTLSDFVISSAYDAAVKTLEDMHVIELGRRDQEAFVEALLIPEPPNKKLQRAAHRYARMKR